MADAMVALVARFWAMWYIKMFTTRSSVMQSQRFGAQGINTWDDQTCVYQVLEGCTLSLYLWLEIYHHNTLEIC